MDYLIYAPRLSLLVSYKTASHHKLEIRSEAKTEN